jgi:hypothetical protein
MTFGAKIEAAIEEMDFEEPDLKPDSYYLNPAPDDPDFQMTFTTADLDKQMADIEAGRSKTISWEEVKRRGHAIRA